MKVKIYAQSVKKISVYMIKNVFHMIMNARQEHLNYKILVINASNVFFVKFAQNKHFVMKLHINVILVVKNLNLFINMNVLDIAQIIHF